MNIDYVMAFLFFGFSVTNMCLSKDPMSAVCAAVCWGQGIFLLRNAVRKSYQNSKKKG